jgi:hypothetical protein
MPRVQPTHKQYPHLIADIERGDIKIPQFQREFVWDIEKSAKLIDSILKGFPIGSFILWKTNDQLRSVRGLGRGDFPTRAGESVNYVLDGQQRLTSIYCCLTGSKIHREIGKPSDYSTIYVDLDADEDSVIAAHFLEAPPKDQYIKIVDLLSVNFELIAKFTPERRAKIQSYYSIINAYSFPLIEISDATIDVATEIFTRINLGGKPLTVFEIMVAKTYDESLEFDLSKKCQTLKERLQSINYETISETTFLQVGAAIIRKDITSKSILQINKEIFVNHWEKIADAIERACEYLKNYNRIPVSRLLPYNAFLVPYSYFFFHHPDRPIDVRQSLLEDFFWKCAIGARYSSSLESKVNQDLKKIDQILKSIEPQYEWQVSIKPSSLIANGKFNSSKAFVKAILCLYAHHEPKSFADGAVVNISNYWLKQANSKNYHHFFPRKSSACKGKDGQIINNVFNITIVDDFLNKRSIKARNPSDYIAQFKKSNRNLAQALKTHLIGDIEEFGIADDLLEVFVQKRAELVSRVLSTKMRDVLTEQDVLNDEDEYNEPDEDESDD